MNTNNYFNSIPPSSFDYEYMDSDPEASSLELRLENIQSQRFNNPSNLPDRSFSSFQPRRSTLTSIRNAQTMHDMARGSELKGRGSRHGQS